MKYHVYHIHNLPIFKQCLNRYLRQYKLDRKGKCLYREFAYNEWSKSLEKDYDEMAKKTGKGRSASFGDDYQFAAITLAADEIAVFDKWLEKNKADYELCYDRMLRDGWKGSVRWVDEQESMIFSATQVDEGDKNHKITVSSWSDDPFEAFWFTWYKIYIMYPDQKLPTEAQGKRRG